MRPHWPAIGRRNIWRRRSCAKARLRRMSSLSKAMTGRAAGELAGLGRNGIVVAGDVAPLLQAADALIEFTMPAATLVFAEMAAKAGLVHVIGTTGHSAEEEAVIAKAANRATIVK